MKFGERDSSCCCKQLRVVQGKLLLILHPFSMFVSILSYMFCSLLRCIIQTNKRIWMNEWMNELAIHRAKIHSIWSLPKQRKYSKGSWYGDSIALVSRSEFKIAVLVSVPTDNLALKPRVLAQSFKTKAKIWFDGTRLWLLDFTLIDAGMWIYVHKITNIRDFKTTFFVSRRKFSKF